MVCVSITCSNSYSHESCVGNHLNRSAKDLPVVLAGLHLVQETQSGERPVASAFYGWRNMVSTLNDQRVRTLAKTATASSICLSVICRWVTAR